MTIFNNDSVKKNIGVMESRVVSGLWDYLPSIGVIAFVILFVIASTLYSGGTLFNIDYQGYDWFHNYWCDLMAASSLNGAENGSRTIAIIAWVILCICILQLLIRTFTTMIAEGWIRNVLYTSSFLAMFIGLFAFTKHHDIIVAVCFPFGAIAAFGLSYGLLHSDLRFYKAAIWVCIVMLSASFFMYFTNIGLYWLGLTQKLTLAFVFIWLIGFNKELIKMESHKA